MPHTDTLTPPVYKTRLEQEIEKATVRMKAEALEAAQYEQEAPARRTAGRLAQLQALEMAVTFLHKNGVDSKTLHQLVDDVIARSPRYFSAKSL
ncbi:MAG: hypothetical protein KGJ06_05785 [Pseudomonadota bacterium]|nr:hypothetical protein [Pseudomonadota bacterium]